MDSEQEDDQVQAKRKRLTDGQELVVYKKGIIVEDNETKGVNWQDLFAGIFGMILLIGTVIVLPIYIVTEEDQEFLIAPAVILWCIYNCCARNNNSTAAYLGNLNDFL